jgi:hypothetical protein
MELGVIEWERIFVDILVEVFNTYSDLDIVNKFNTAVHALLYKTRL